MRDNLKISYYGVASPQQTQWKHRRNILANASSPSFIAEAALTRILPQFEAQN